MFPARVCLSEYGSMSRRSPWYPRSTSKRFTAANRTGSRRFPNPVVQKVGGGVQRSSSSASGTGSGDSSPLSQAKTRGNSDQKWSKSGRALNWRSSIFAHSVSSSSNIGEVRDALN